MIELTYTVNMAEEKHNLGIEVMRENCYLYSNDILFIERIRITFQWSKFEEWIFIVIDEVAFFMQNRLEDELFCV